MTRRPACARLVGVGVIAALVGLGSGPAASTAAAETGGIPKAAQYTPAPPAPKGAEVVKVGIEPIGFDGIDISQQSFKASFYIWWRWRGKTDPVPTTDVLNSDAAGSNFVVNYSYTNAAGKERPVKLRDGERYQTARISTGLEDPFPVDRYPLDHQNLLIRFENNTDDFAQIVYLPDTANMTKHRDVEVSGWKVTGQSLRAVLHTYGTNFGVVGGGPASTRYSQLEYDVAIERPVSHFVIKLFIPLLVIFSASLAALLVKEDKSDVRLLMVATGLLTLILLQQGYGADLPATAPGVLMDDIYIAAYTGLAITFLRVIYTANQIRHLEKPHHDFIRADRLIAGAIWSAFLVTSALLVAL